MKLRLTEQVTAFVSRELRIFRRSYLLINLSSATRAAFDWPVIGEELFSLMLPVREALNCGAISTNEAASTFPNLIGAHLRNSGVLTVDPPPGPR